MNISSVSQGLPQDISDLVPVNLFDTISKNVTEWITTASEKISSAAHFLIENAGPYLRELSLRVQQVYQHLTPYLSAAADFVRSHLGCSLLCLAGSITSLVLADKASRGHGILHKALVVTGISLGALSMIFLSASGKVPFLPKIQLA